MLEHERIRDNRWFGWSLVLLLCSVALSSAALGYLVGFVRCLEKLP